MPNKLPERKIVLLLLDELGIDKMEGKPEK